MERTVDRWAAKDLGKAIEEYLEARLGEREFAAGWESPTRYEHACIALAESIDAIVRERIRRAA